MLTRKTFLESLAHNFSLFIKVLKGSRPSFRVKDKIRLQLDLDIG